MKYPKKIEIKLADNNTLIIDLLNVRHDAVRDCFVTEVRISPELVNSTLDKNVITFETEEK